MKTILAVLFISSAVVGFVGAAMVISGILRDQATEIRTDEMVDQMRVQSGLRGAAFAEIAVSAARQKVLEKIVEAGRPSPANQWTGVCLAALGICVGLTADLLSLAV